MTAKRMVHMLVSILAVGLAGLLGTAVYYGAIMHSTLKQVTTADEPQILLAVYVLEEDPARSIEDTAGYTYGVSGDGRVQEALASLFTQLEDTLGGRPERLEFQDLFALADGLREKTCAAMALDEALFASLTETEGYEWMRQGVRRLTTYAFAQEEPAAQAETSGGGTSGETGAEEEYVQDGYQPAPAAPQKLSERFVVYISGIDTFGGISARSRSDVNILAAVDTQARRIQLVSTPRDYYVDFAAVRGSKDKLTHAGLYGVGASMDALRRLYDMDIDYYLRLNFSGFVQIIDALGGIQVYSDYAFTVENVRDYKKGYNQLNGQEALAFARERYSFENGDYQRAKHQMEVIRAVLEKCTSPAILQNYQSVMEGIAGSFETNMPRSQILSLAMAQLTDGRQWDVSTFTVQGTGARRVTYSMPGRSLYVILPDQASVAQAKERLRDITG